jgi:hypothetical protein
VPDAGCVEQLKSISPVSCCAWRSDVFLAQALFGDLRRAMDKAELDHSAREMKATPRRLKNVSGRVPSIFRQRKPRSKRRKAGSTEIADQSARE